MKRFEHLDVRDRDAEIKDRNKKHEAELRRAQIAREEAESDVKRLREDIRLLERENEAGRERERAARDRLEIVMVSCSVLLLCACGSTNDRIAGPRLIEGARHVTVRGIREGAS